MKSDNEQNMDSVKMVSSAEKFNKILWLLVGLIVGFAFALIFCYFTWISDLRGHLAAKEKALSEWEELNRQERATIATIKNMSIDEINIWVAENNKLSTYFMDMQRRLHQLELELSGPGTTYIIIGVIALLVVVSLVVFWLRSADHTTAALAEEVISLPPNAMVRAIQARSLAVRKEPITITVEERASCECPQELPDTSQK